MWENGQGVRVCCRWLWRTFFFFSSFFPGVCRSVRWNRRKKKENSAMGQWSLLPAAPFPHRSNTPGRTWPCLSCSVCQCCSVALVSERGVYLYSVQERADQGGGRSWQRTSRYAVASPPAGGYLSLLLRRWGSGGGLRTFVECRLVALTICAHAEPDTSPSQPKAHGLCT